MLDTANRKMYQDAPMQIYPIFPQCGFHFNTSSDCDKFQIRAGTKLSINSQTEIVNAQDFSLDYSQLTVSNKVNICEQQSRLFSSGNVMNTCCWIKNITLAADHHCCNVELEADKDGLVLTVKRTVMPGEPLLMWFGERFRALLNIPFLTGCHIEENLTYKCHVCERIFDRPNPLKMHIALNCDKLNIDFIWKTVAVKCAKSSFLINNILNNAINYTYQHLNYQLTSNLSLPYHNSMLPKLQSTLIPLNVDSQSFPIYGTPGIIANSSPVESLKNVQVGKTFSESSASSSLLSPERSAFTIKAESFKKHQPSRSSAFEMFSKHTVNTIKNYHHLDKMVGYNNDVSPLTILDPLVLETEASCTGKTTTGDYQCIICQKKYSRKYGLKIHFRTHTGYKPLTCKYCGRAFGDPSNLNKHVRLHLNSENARYKCEYCGRGMVRRRDLERHIQKKHSVE